MSKKKLTKQIKEISDKLPPVKEEHASGFTSVLNEEGTKVFKPNTYLVDVNHERRLRHAYERHGMEGIKSYLESITKLQTNRKNELNNKDARD